MFLFHTMKYFLSLIFFACSLFLNLKPAFAWFWEESANVAYQSEIIKLNNSTAYVEVDLWYPTLKQPALRSIQRDDKLFYVANKALPIEEKLNFILISVPPFAESIDFAKLSYKLAEQGFLVVTVTHTFDSKFQMQHTMSAIQFYSRALQIEGVLNYIANNDNFLINKENISIISFTETALSSLLLNNYKLNSEQYNSYCLQTLASSSYEQSAESSLANTNSSESFCLASYSKQVTSIIDTIYTATTLFNNEQRYIDIPQIKNYFFIEPVLTFLFEAENTLDANYNFYPIYTNQEYFSSQDVQYDYLTSLNNNTNLIELDIPSYIAIADACPPSELPSLDAICLDIPDSKRDKYIENLVENIKQNLENHN